MNLAIEKEWHVDGVFHWLDRKGELHPVNTMETFHLLSTVMMIWNHTVSDEFKIKPYKEYNFPIHYSDTYMAEAFEAMNRELRTRTDFHSRLFQLETNRTGAFIFKLNKIDENMKAKKE